MKQNSKRYNRLSTAVVLTFLAFVSWSQSIANIEGKLQNGETVTIPGNKFGSRPGPAPVCLSINDGQELVVTTDIEYYRAPDNTGKMVSLKLDAYQYPATSPGKRPVFILVHGGSFRGGDKGYTASQGNFHRDVATEFANRGYVAFSINYRLKMTDYLGAALDDVDHALKWIKAHRETYNIDTTKVLIAGDSAGGAIAVNASYKNPELCTYAGCVDMWGGLPPYDDSGNTGPVNTFPVTTDTPPTCIIHGTADETVYYAVSEKLSNELKQAGIYSEFHSFEGTGHYPREQIDEVIQILVDFADKIILPTSSHLQSCPATGQNPRLLATRDIDGDQDGDQLRFE
jgi:acetyl esterase/lipase